MIRSFNLLLILLVLTGVSAAQNMFVNKSYGFAMQEPKGWITTNKSELTENLKKFDLDDEARERLLKENSGSIIIAAFTKYSPKEKAGLIPTIQVIIRPKSSISYEQFSKAIVRSIEGMKSTFEDFELIGPSQEIDISGVRSVLTTVRFSIIGRGQPLKVRSRTYGIPMDKYFFQVNFTDGFGAEDCAEEFDRLVKTIKVGREAVSQIK